MNRSTPNFNIVRHRNESNDLSMTTSRKTRRNMSQDKFRNTNEFINKKREDSYINYQQNEIANFNSYYIMKKKKDNEIINHKR